MSVKDILEAVTVTAELTNTELSTAAKVAMADDLAAYPENSVMVALRRCRRELRGRLSLSEILVRLDDGRPGVEEAWSMYPKDEAGSAVATNEMNLAMSAAWPLIQDGDKIAGRMAFKESYERIIAENRAQGVAPKWEVSLGQDRTTHEGALLEATRKNRIGVDHALRLLPSEIHERFLLAAGERNHPLLAGPSHNQVENISKVKALIGDLRVSLPVTKK